MSLLARFPAHPFRVAVPDWKPPWWITRTLVFTPWRRSSSTARLAASASSWKVRPATPVGVTIVGVASSTSPMTPIVNFLPLSLLIRVVPTAGNSVCPLSLRTTLADRYWKSAPG